ncbi:imidazole glycerol phosphate synthase subunit HisH [Flavobacterium sp.]|uniref:imidazole glycerol phosphate synthase subunit HisH n=1 Tax=Flavobacterium sp. TaxID=239 RepID=UPI00120CEAA8|nr:imidazole glycerol phosphate synthase subunit HisH [Flavobacterium sp.]RZJ69514.1 MAG: imidazole glycerol phosphate synthase subunit HisH [Flavobacterium sp.]
MIAIIDYKAGNTGSVGFALERLGFDFRITSDHGELLEADKVIFPGVGSAGEAMQRLRDSGLDEILPKLTQPVLGICLGMQLMCRHSQEDDTFGLGIFDVDVKRFPDKLRVPHTGWNDVAFENLSAFENLEKQPDLYFVHSYFVPINAYTTAVCDYGIRFSAGLKKDNFHAFQFHPEKSGKTGAKLLKNFLES